MALCPVTKGLPCSHFICFMNDPMDGRFPTTQWTLIQRLKSEDEQVSSRALDDLCRQYHYPLYCYTRRRGLDHHDAQDALHDFLAKLLRLDSLQSAEAERGRLRGFLCTSLQRFLINWNQRQKTHGMQRAVSLEDLSDSERRYELEKLTDADTPERIFNRKWSHELLKRVLQNLEADYERAGKLGQYLLLKPVLLTGGSLRDHDAGQIASAMNVTPGALKLRLHRLLKDYRSLLRHEVLQTVESQEDVETEIAHLMEVFRDP